MRKRSSEFPCNKEIFEKAIPPCNDALKKCIQRERRLPPVILLIRNKESARSCGSMQLVRLMYKQTLSRYF